MKIPLINRLKWAENERMKEPWYKKYIRLLEGKLKHAEKEKEQAEDEAERLRKEKEGLEGEVKDLKRQLEEMAGAKASKRPRFPDYGLQKHERALKKSVHKSTGRIPFEEKLKQVQFTKDVYPAGIPPEKCILRSQRIVTHMKDGQKEYFQTYLLLLIFRQEVWFLFRETSLLIVSNKDS